MTAERIIENHTTGWVSWRYVKVAVERRAEQAVLTCEASVTNVSQNSPECVVSVALDNPKQGPLEFKFWMKPDQSEVVTMEKVILGASPIVTDVDLDEF